MYYAFWGIIFLIAFVAGWPLLWALRNQRAVPRYAKMMVFSLIPILAGILYWGFGNPKSLEHYWQADQKAKTVVLDIAKIKDPRQAVYELKSFLHGNPKNPEVWYLLGKLYYKGQDFKKATGALGEAHNQVSKNIAYSVAYAKADFFYHNHRLIPKTEALMHAVIKRDKNNIDALNLLALNYSLHREYRLATLYWKRLLPLLSVDAGREKVLSSIIRQVQMKDSHSEEKNI